MRMQPIAPQELHDIWEYVVPGLQACVSQDVLQPRVEDIYATLRAGAASLYVFREEHNDAFIGFVVLQLNPNPWNGHKVLHIWYAHAQNRLDEAFHAVEDLARKLAIPSITFSSSRTAFENLMKPLGFELRQVEYIKQVSANG